MFSKPLVECLRVYTANLEVTLYAFTVFFENLRRKSALASLSVHVLTAKIFMLSTMHDKRASGPVSKLNKKEAENIAELLREYRQSRNQTVTTAASAIKGFSNELHSTQKLWKQGNKSMLIKAGLALIALPDPGVGDVVGSAMVAAGLIQMKIRNSALHVDDVYKTFPEVMKELGAIKSRVI
jgi:hypothetical protein